MSFLYLKHFELSKAPFQITPDIDFFFSGSHRGDIITALLHVACHEEGIITTVAEVGSGKTLLARLMISRLPADISTVYLANPSFSRDEILGAIARDLGIATPAVSAEEKLAQLHQELLRRHSLGQRVLLVIDEAHAMPVESIEEVRLLSNLETSQHKLVNIMLFGQPELDVLLADQRLRQVRDRVIHRFELPALRPDEAAAYIDHRLRIAGWRGSHLFTPAAATLLISSSEGRTRRINLLADKALLAAYAEGGKQVEKRHVKHACNELQPDAKKLAASGIDWLRTLAISLLMAVPMTSLAVWLLAGRQTHPTVPVAAIAPSSIKNVLVTAPPVPEGTAEPAPVVLAVTPTTLSAPTIAPTSAAVPVATPVSLSQATVTAPAAIFVPPQPPPVAAVTKPVVAADPKPASPSPSVDRLAAQRSADLSKISRLRGGTVVKRTDDLIEKKKLRGFTLQLATLSSIETLTDYLRQVEKHVDIESIYAHNRTYDGKTLIAVYVGQYRTEPEARSALDNLPASLKTYQPIIRTWIGIRHEPKPPNP